MTFAPALSHRCPVPPGVRESFDDNCRYGNAPRPPTPLATAPPPELSDASARHIEASIPLLGSTA